MTAVQVNYTKHNDYYLCIEKQMKNYNLQIKIFFLSDQLLVFEACSLTDAALWKNILPIHPEKAANND